MVGLYPTRSLSIYLWWILESIDAIRIHTSKWDKKDPLSDSTVFDACMMQLQHIWETIIQIEKHYPMCNILQAEEIIGLRHIISHHYIKIRKKFIEKIVFENINELEANIKDIMKDMKS